VTAAPSLALTRLTLTDFRNYAGLRLDAASSAVALVGPNGAGKTNLLEAISLLAPGRGLRAAAFADLARQGGAVAWAIAAELQTPAGRVSLGTAWSGEPDVENGGRTVVIDAVAQRSSGALGRHVRMLWLTPAMDRLFAGPAADRRRFLDRQVQAFDPEHGGRVAAFEKLMRERNLLLEAPHADAAWLASLERRMAEAGIAVAAARLAAVDALQRHIAKGEGPGGFPWAQLTMKGDTEDLLAAAPAVRAEDEYRRVLAQSRGADRAAGRTLHGPHRSDLLVFYGAPAMPAAQCSTGEQKALLIALILAQARAVKEESRVAPILLLDEVAAHLDRDRRRCLFDALDGLGCQAWMSGTDAELFGGLGRDATILQVLDGKVSDAK
jgi:DNA replication and repair protein RecF